MTDGTFQRLGVGHEGPLAAGVAGVCGYERHQRLAACQRRELLNHPDAPDSNDKVGFGPLGRTLVNRDAQ
jgi:hypothetical protein